MGGKFDKQKSESNTVRMMELLKPEGKAELGIIEVDCILLT